MLDQYFYQGLGVSRDELAPELEMFYRDVFPELRDIIDVRPDAVALIDEAVSRGYRIVIATNPLFPETAIYQRLVWGNLSPDEYSFELIANWGTFHFAKPNPAYFAEVLAKLGWPSGPVIMVGDHPENDIKGASLFGLSTFWLEMDSFEGESIDPEKVAATGRGSLSDIIPWIDATPLEEFIPEEQTPAIILAMHQGVAAGMHSLIEDITPDMWDIRPGENKWTLKEIFCHIRDVETRVNLPRLKQILKEDTPFVPGIDTDAWYQVENYDQQDIQIVIDEYFSTRGKIIQVLQNMAPEDWERPARHAIFGPTQLQELLHISSEHDILHLRQISDLLKIGIPRVDEVKC